MFSEISREEICFRDGGNSTAIPAIPTANRIKKSGVIDKAITQCGRKIIVDSELALQLVGRKPQG